VATEKWKSKRLRLRLKIMEQILETKIKDGWAIVVVTHQSASQGGPVQTRKFRALVEEVGTGDKIISEFRDNRSKFSEIINE